MKSYNVIGMMSGSSLDGIDLVYCTFEYDEGQWSYAIVQSEFIPYPHKWKLRLRNLVLQNAITYIKTHTFYGHYIGEVIQDFVKKYELEGKVDFIASHGQTIFHQPDKLLTSQIGDGAAIAIRTKIPVICNFRTNDVAVGGQGAPIVPIGDRHLFSDYRFCLNLGGIANISAEIDGKRIVAYDICACNLLLDRLAHEVDKDYDPEGQIAASGLIHPPLLEELNQSWYYNKSYPKSLSAGWVNKVILPIFRHYPIPIENLLRTVVEHIAQQIGRDIEHIYEQENMDKAEGEQLLITGGGAFNTFLIQRIQANTSLNVVVPDDVTVKFKEALIMAFVGVLRMRGEPNCLACVTGAKRDTVGGMIYHA